MEFIKAYLPVALAVLAGFAAFFNLKADVRSNKESMTTLQDQTDATEAKTRLNAEDIKQLQFHQIATVEHRDTLNKLLEKIDTRIERQDEKMDRMLTAITQVDTKLQERTKELHS